MDTKKAMKKNITGTVAISMIFIFCILLLNKLLPLFDSFLMVVIPVIMLFLNRKILPENWPFENGVKMPVTSFLTALGFFGIYQAIIGSLAGGVTEPDTINAFTFPVILFMGIVTPIGEELMFRGVVMNRLKKHGVIFAMVISSIIFGAYHANLVQLFSATLLGLALSYVALNYSIIYSMILHFINNFFFALLLPHLAWNMSIPYLPVYIALAMAVPGIIGLILGKTWKNIGSFLAEHKGKNQEGCWKAFFLNPLFIGFLVFIIIFTVLVVIGLMYM